MKVKFQKIENIVSWPTRFFNHPAVRHDCEVSFSTPAIAGDAFLRIHELVRGRGGQEVALDKDVELWGSYLEGKIELADLGSTDALPESVKPLGPRGHFEMIAHFEWYERISLMPPPCDAGLSACDFYFPLRAENFRQGRPEIESGNLVRIRTQRVAFVALGTLDKNLRGEKRAGKTGH